MMREMKPLTMPPGRQIELAFKINSGIEPTSEMLRLFELCHDLKYPDLHGESQWLCRGRETPPNRVYVGVHEHRPGNWWKVVWFWVSVNVLLDENSRFLLYYNHALSELESAWIHDQQHNAD